MLKRIFMRHGWELLGIVTSLISVECYRQQGMRDARHQDSFRNAHEVMDEKLPDNGA